MFRTALQQAETLLLPMSKYSRVLKQQTRTTVVVRRMFPEKVWDKDRTRQLNKRTEKTYILVEDRRGAPAGDMEVLLTRNMPGVGDAGEVVTVPKRIARNRMIPLGIATYASPENVAKFAAEKDDREEEIPDVTQKTIRQLEGMTLPIPMSSNVNWVLNANHVRLAFRKVGVVVPLHAITIPKDPLTEPGDVTVVVRISGKYDVKVKGIIFHYTKENLLPENITIWSRTKVTLEDSLKQMFKEMR